MTQEQKIELKKFCIENAKQYSSSINEMMNNAKEIYDYLINKD